MAQTIKLKRSATQGAVPSTSALALGEIAINTYDGNLFIKKNDGSESIVTIGGLADNAVTSAKIAANAVEASEIATNAVGISELNVSDGTSGQILTTDGAGSLSFTSKVSTAQSFYLNSATGDGSTTDFSLSTTPAAESNIIAFIDGVFQTQDSYTFSGTTLSFSSAPPNGTEVTVYVVGSIFSGNSVVLDTFSGDDSTTQFTLSENPENENNTQVYIDGVYQQKSEYSVSSQTLTFSSAPPTGTNNIEVVAFSVTNLTVLNANSVSSASIAANAVTSTHIAANQVGISELNLSDGTNGQVITTDGSGTLSFSTISGYTDSDVETYLDGGTSTPTFATATVSGTANFGSLSDGTITITAFADEDNMVSNSATLVPTQQSVKAYVDTEVAGIVDSAPGTLDTLNELAAALGDDANFSTTVTNSIATKLPLAGGTMTGTIAGFTSTGIDDNATSTAITIDSSGNLLVGKSAVGVGNAGIELRANNLAAISRASDNVLYLNRITDTGSILEFRKDNVAVGNIGVVSTDRMYFATADGLGLQFDKDNNRIVPCDTAGAYNNNVELGDSSLEFTNLWLSGTATMGGLTVNSGTTNGAEVSIISTNTANAGANNPRLKLYRSGVLSGGFGQGGLLEFAGQNASGTEKTYATISGDIFDTTASSEDGYLTFKTMQAGTLTAAMEIDHQGNVGIGTSSPTRKLHVNSGIEGISAGIAGSTYGIRFDNGGSYSSNMSTIHGVDDTLTGSYQPIMLNGSDVRFGTSSTERMRIDSSGNVGIGETDPDKILHLKSNSVNNSMIKIESTATNSYPGIQIVNDAQAWEISTHGAHSDALTFYNGTNHTMKLDTSGAIVANLKGTSSTTAATGLIIHGGGQSDETEGGVGGATNTFVTNMNRQIVLQFRAGASTGYAHAIHTRHNSGHRGNNTIDFYNWEHGTAANALPAKRSFSIHPRAIELVPTTTAERDLFNAGNYAYDGMLIYNSNEKKFQGRVDGAWQNITAGDDFPVTTDLYARYTADSFTNNGSSTAPSWTDLSGNGRNITTTSTSTGGGFWARSGSTWPTKVSSNATNGALSTFNCVQFDTSEGMALPDKSTIASAATTGFTFAYVARYTVSGERIMAGSGSNNLVVKDGISIFDTLEYEQNSNVDVRQNELLYDLLLKMIDLNPETRYNVIECINHPYFKMN